MKSYIRPSGMANHQPEIIDLMFKIVATVAQDSTSHLSTSIIPVGPYNDCGVVVNAGITQAQIDALLPNTAASDVLVTPFGSTRLGTDMVGFICNFDGSIKELIAVEASIVLTAKGTNVKVISIPTGTALADADAGSITFEKSVAGNVYGSITLANLDAASAGMIHLRVICRLK